MLRKQTLLVVGAGASQELGFPLGIELARRVSSSLDFRWKRTGEVEQGDFEIYASHIDWLEPDVRTRWLFEARSVASGILLHRSVDNFLDSRENDVVSILVKAAIVRQITYFERHSALCVFPQIDKEHVNFLSLEDAWLNKFSSILFSGVRRSEVSKVFDRLAIVCFNYDRRIEQYFHHVLASHFAIEPKEALAIVNNLRIVHPYGVIGGAQHLLATPFGKEIQAQGLASVSKDIRTYSERREDEEFTERLHEYVGNADTIVFLGIAYHKQNMDLLISAARATPKRRRLFGSAWGISDYDTAMLSAHLQGRLSGSHGHASDYEFRNKLRCGPLVDEYRMSLSDSFA